MADTEQAESVLPVHFVWHVPDRGYIWDEAAPLGRTGRGQFLVVAPGAREAHRYCPLDDEEPSPCPSFKEFIELKTAKDIQRFANRYGWLGLSEGIDNARTGSSIGESLVRWGTEIQRLRALSTLWGLVCSQNEERLGQIVEWTSDNAKVRVRLRGDGPPFGFHSESWQKRVVDIEGLPYQDKRMPPGDRLGPAKLCLLESLNKTLRAMVAPCVLLTRKRKEEGYLRPRHLLGALWLQFYQAIVGKYPVRPCVYCGKFFNVSEGSPRLGCPPCVNKAKTYRRRFQERLEKIEARLANRKLSRKDRGGLLAKKADLRKDLKKWGVRNGRRT